MLGPPAGTRIRKKRKINNKGEGVICALSAKQVIAPKIQVKNQDVRIFLPGLIMSVFVFAYSSQQTVPGQRELFFPF